MGIFGTIMSKLGFGDKHEDAAPADQAPATDTASADAAPAAPVAMSEVDVAGKLDQLAENSSEDLNWQTSIVDMLKLLGMDSSLEHRKQLASELNCPADLMDDSASMNIWLHKTVLQQLAANGGNVPANLLA